VFLDPDILTGVKIAAIRVHLRGGVFHFQFKFGDPGSDFRKTCWDEKRDNYLMFKFQVCRACFHGEEASESKRW